MDLFHAREHLHDVAAALPGSDVHDVTRQQALESGIFRLGHPTGTIRVEAELTQPEGSVGYQVRRAELLRTARKLMDGRVYVAAGQARHGNPTARQQVTARMVDKRRLVAPGTATDAPGLVHDRRRPASAAAAAGCSPAPASPAGRASTTT